MTLAPRPVEGQKTVAEAIIGKERVIGARVTPEERARTRAVEKMRQERAAGVSDATIAEDLGKLIPRTTEADINNVAGQNFRDSETTDPNVTRWKREVKNVGEGALTLINEGYDTLHVDQQTLVLMGLEAVVQSNQYLKECYDALPDTAARNALLEKWARNPDFVKALAEGEGLKKLFSEEGVIPDTIADAEAQHKKAKRRYDAKNNVLKSTQADLQTTRNRLNSYKDLTGTRGGSRGENYDDLMDLRGRAPGMRNDLRRYEAELVKLQRNIDALDRKPGIPVVRGQQIIGSQEDPDITRQKGIIQENIDRIQDDHIAPLTEDLGKLTAMEQEIANLEQKQVALVAEEAQQIEDFADEELAYDTSKRNLDRAKATRKADQEAYYHKVSGIYVDAAARFLKAEAVKWGEYQRIVRDEEIVEELDVDKKTIEEGMRDEWEDRTTESVRRGFKRVKKDVWKVNKDRTTKAFDRAVMDGKVDGIILDMLIAKIPYPEHTVKYEEELARIQERMKDEAFLTEMTGKVTERLFENLASTGEKPTKNQVRLLRQAGMLNQLKTKLEANPQLKAEAEAIAGKGILDKLKDASDGNLLKILLLALAGIAGGAVLVGGLPLAAGVGAAVGKGAIGVGQHGIFG